MMTNVDKAAKLLENQDFVLKLSKCNDKDAMLALFKDNGAEITLDELNQFGSLLKAVVDNDGELPDEIAEQVAGGAFDITRIGELLGAFGKFLSGMAEPLNTIISIFTTDKKPADNSGSGSAT